MQNRVHHCWFDLTNYRTQGKHANHYTIDAFGAIQNMYDDLMMNRKKDCHK
jgi:hypothetical protein